MYAYVWYAPVNKYGVWRSLVESHFELRLSHVGFLSRTCLNVESRFFPPQTVASRGPAEIAVGRAGARARVRTGKLASGLKRHDDVAGERAVWE